MTDFLQESDFTDERALHRAKELGAIGLGPVVYSSDRDAPHDEKHPVVVANDQIVEALNAIDRPESSYFRFPFLALDKLTGAIPPGDVWFVCAFSGNGKTAFVSSMIDRLIVGPSTRVYVMPLESEPLVFRTHLACKRLGLHAGMLLTGQYRRELDPVTFGAMRESIRSEIASQQAGNMAERLYVSPVKAVTVPVLERAMRHAAELQADVFIVDHIDHVGDDTTTNEFAERVRVQNRLLRLTQELGLHTVATSQLNNEAVAGDVLAQYQPPRPQHVYGGGKKRQISAGMLGLFRPMRFDAPTKDELAAVRAGSMEPWRVLEPNCMGVNHLKSRNFGEREYHKAFLKIENGCVSDLPERDLYRTTMRIA